MVFFFKYDKKRAISKKKIRGKLATLTFSDQCHKNDRSYGRISYSINYRPFKSLQNEHLHFSLALIEAELSQ